MANFENVKEYLLDMGFSIDQEDPNGGMGVALCRFTKSR